jgi:hypothetical protein
MTGAGCTARFLFALILSIISSTGLEAKSITIDDSGTQSLEPSVRMRWKSAMPSRSAADDVMIGTTTVRVRINVAPWLKRAGRIYLSLPAQEPGPVLLSWSTQGRFMPGQVRSGNRVLIYAGPITTPFMEDTLMLRFVVSGFLLRRAVPVAYHFEMDES